ncbi:hypothetical protein Rhopal_003708-T1 [Rhodotorula paludigena]|uniref:DNA topoisomerase (ATP-hydrolyzing) n=1 Tax=Rhodotorula paludigena TaxID=86838 RepID=A0AAV5GN69_9BASI|nr:hypothetical protein Rhopal_003708-T1 [Rhodotorula paludigena]
MSELLDWDDQLSPARAHDAGRLRAAVPAAGRSGFHGERTSSVASTAFSVLTEGEEVPRDGYGGCASDGDAQEDEGDEAVEDEAGWTGDIGAASDELPELSFSSPYKQGTPVPEPVTPHLGDFDLLDSQLFFLSQSTTAGEVPFSSHSLDLSELQSGDELLSHADKPRSARSPTLPRSTTRIQSPDRSPFPATKHPRLHSSTPLDDDAITERPSAEARPAAVGCAGRPKSPTQAEMDAFFGYVDPLADVRKEPVADRRMEHDASAERGAGLERVDQQQGTEQEADDEASRATSLSAPSHKRQQASEKEFKDEGAQYYQLAPIPTVSSATRLPLSQPEKRHAIVEALERLALSVLSQIVDALVPDQQPSASQQTSEEVLTSAWQQVKIVLAKRGGPDGATRKTQRLVFPRRYGHGGNLRLGGRELAALLKVIELVLEGLKTGAVSTKRDLFYRDAGLFGKQSVVDSLVDDLAATLQVKRSDLNVAATAKGLFVGALKLVLNDGSEVTGGDTGALVPTSASIERVETQDVKWILVVEKDAVFQSLITPEILQDSDLGEGILFTGKGYPDLATRELLNRLARELPDVPIFALVDADPHGLDILSVYRFGSSLQSHDADNLVVPRIQWLGLKGTEWDALDIDRDELLLLTAKDRTKALAMLRRPTLPDEWRRELEYMLHLGRKAEIQILSSSPRTAAASDDQAPDLTPAQAQDSLKTGAKMAPSRLVEYVKRALWLALDDEEPGEGDSMIN